MPLKTSPGPLLLPKLWTCCSTTLSTTPHTKFMNSKSAPWNHPHRRRLWPVWARRLVVAFHLPSVKVRRKWTSRHPRNPLIYPITENKLQETAKNLDHPRHRGTFTHTIIRTWDSGILCTPRLTEVSFSMIFALKPHFFLIVDFCMEMIMQNFKYDNLKEF